MALFHYFLCLSSIPFHIFFFHSSVDGYIGFFYVLSLVNSAAMSIGVNISFKIIVFSRYMFKSGIARS